MRNSRRKLIPNRRRQHFKRFRPRHDPCAFRVCEKVGMGAEVDGVSDRGEDGREEGVLHEVHEFGTDHGEVELEVGGDVWLAAFVV